jgi:hypothetical protein
VVAGVVEEAVAVAEVAGGAAAVDAMAGVTATVIAAGIADGFKFAGPE